MTQPYEMPDEREGSTMESSTNKDVVEFDPNAPLGSENQALEVMEASESIDTIGREHLIYASE
ncbi:MAG: hypothetical protein GPI99_17290 [Microcystis aeruginosa W13-15]|nr:hypothetical protein [Microcystis aeruginosa W13-16]NCQ75353.1 hypothetical protein [Microcystis aeruginosa W13-13]NCQ79797.1 hypothetical protein [Microcystis aeruginosa W13-15]